MEAAKRTYYYLSYHSKSTLGCHYLHDDNLRSFYLLPQSLNIVITSLSGLIFMSKTDVNQLEQQYVSVLLSECQLEMNFSLSLDKSYLVLSEYNNFKDYRNARFYLLIIAQDKCKLVRLTWGINPCNFLFFLKFILKLTHTLPIGLLLHSYCSIHYFLI